ncbi:olfactory receptor 6N2-like [Bombina bombina]|uniref:olfactory receptor 6N2-like n=1 Tax=Bombina bombina TaxID=8345 RepID=UPI00235AB6B0|nr:olfactory receptor 6N2-like [Bombina bombina]
MEINHTNHSLVTKFIIVGFTDLNGCESLLFILLFLIYLFTLSGNVTVITLIYTQKHLQVPLYFFVVILSFLEIWYTTVTIPKMLANLLNQKLISFIGCILQIYFLHCLGITETYLLTAMAFDRYVAICNPLRYPTIMNTTFCFHLIGCCWVLGFIWPVPQILLLSKLKFCSSNKIDHVFCDFDPLMKLACSDISLNLSVDFVMFSILLLFALFCIIYSYFKIISVILKIRSKQGQKRAFSTCVAHLTVVILFFGSAGFMYVRFTKNYPIVFDRGLAVIYSVITPMCNPIIYSLRNREIRDVIRKRLSKLNNY